MTGRERILNFLQNRAVDRRPFMPITMMFAADQIGARYRDYVTDYRVLAEAQQATAERFDIDYVSVISDPAREAADCGAAVDFFDDQPPAIDESRALLAEKSRLDSLQIPDPRRSPRMSDRLHGISLLRREAGDRRLVEGWIEGPCAEGADLRGINNLMLDFYDDPGFVESLFEFVVEMELRFAAAQVEAGADFIGIGDAASSLVGPTLYRRFVWPFQQRLVRGVQALGVPVRLHICGNTRPLLADMGALGCEIVDLDYPSPMGEARAAMGPRQILLGNLHPVELVLNGNPERIRTALAACLAAAGPRYIVGAGCEIPRGTPAANLDAMREFAVADR
ncbi:MAG: methylcobamide--CoM methyltransferase [Acidobacteriota bacterium]